MKNSHEAPNAAACVLQTGHDEKGQTNHRDNKALHIFALGLGLLENTVHCRVMVRDGGHWTG